MAGEGGSRHCVEAHICVAVTTSCQALLLAAAERVPRLCYAFLKALVPHSLLTIQHCELTDKMLPRV